MIRVKTFLLLLSGALAVLLLNVLAFSHKSPRLAASSTLIEADFAPRTLALSRPSSPSLLFEREDNAWRLVKPAPLAIESSKILRLVDALATTPIEESLSFVEMAKLKLTREDFGLLEPRVKIALSDGETSRRVSFGNLTPASNGVYVAVSESDAVHVAPRALLDAADLSLDHVRARSLFSMDSSSLAGFDIRLAPESLFTFARSSSGWTLNGQSAFRKTVDDFLTSLLKTRIASFVWPSDAEEGASAISESRLVGYGLDEASAVSIVCHTLAGRDIRLLLGRETDEGLVYALFSGDAAVVAVDASLKASARTLVATCLDKRLFPVEASSVSSITIQKGGVSYVLSRDAAGSWSFAAPLVAPADNALAASLLSRLLSATPDDESPQGVVVSLSSARAPHRLLESTLLGDARLEDLRAREILRLDPALVKRLVVTSSGKSKKSVSCVYARSSRVWLREGDAAALDQKAVEKTLAALNPLVAERVVSLFPSPSDWAHLGFENPFLTVSIDQEKQGSLRRNILIGHKAPAGGRYATVGATESVFILADKVVDALLTPLDQK